jgi:hypothetical protein
MVGRWRRVQKSREERRLKMVDWERRAEINTRKLEEKERRRAEEKDDGSEGEDDSDDFIVSDDLSHEDGYEAGDEPVAADEMSKNIFETGEGARMLDIEPIRGSVLEHAPLALARAIRNHSLMPFQTRLCSLASAPREKSEKLCATSWPSVFASPQLALAFALIVTTTTATFTPSLQILHRNVCRPSP